MLCVDDKTNIFSILLLEEFQHKNMSDNLSEKANKLISIREEIVKPYISSLFFSMIPTLILIESNNNFKNQSV